jgi:hypothetical protein
MLILVVLLAFAALTVVLYRHFRAKRDSRALWRSSVVMGCSVGIARAVLACLGWYGVEHTGGPLQIPAYALAILALPEAIVFGRHRGPLSLNVYISLGLLLIVSTLLLVCAVALAVQLTQGRRDVAENSR